MATSTNRIPPVQRRLTFEALVRLFDREQAGKACHQPGAGDAVNLGAFTGDPLHGASPLSTRGNPADCQASMPPRRNRAFRPSACSRMAVLRLTSWPYTQYTT